MKSYQNDSYNIQISMASKVSNDAFKLIFPRYAELLSQESAPVNQSIEVFLRDELPRKVEMVRGMQACFNAFLTHFTNLILKRPQHSHLIHSLTLKANDKIQKYFQSLSLAAHKMDSNSIKDRIPSIDIQGLKREFKSKLESTNELLKEKYFCGGSLTRQCEEEVAMRLYVLMEIYYFFKNDPVAMAGKFKIKQQDVLWAITRNQEPGDIGSLITLDQNFITSIEETVMKRCRPFVNRRELLQSKVRETLRQGQSKVGPNLNLLIESLISKERGRLGRELSNSLGRELKSLEEGQEEAQVRDLINQSQSLKRQFAQLKNTTYFLDMMRGNFSEKYKMEVHRLENVFYLTNLQKYLQDVSTFLEKVLSLEERIIKNRKDYMRDFGSRVEIKISDLISFYQSKPTGQALNDVVLQQFDQLQSALYGVVNKQPVEAADDYKKRQQREKREADRKYHLERKAQQERQRREEEKYRLQEKRRKQEQRIRQVRLQREQKDRQRREQANRQQQERRLEMQRKREQKLRKDQQARRQRDQQLRKKDEERRIRQAEEKNKREEMNRRKAEQDQRRRIQKEQQTRKRQIERKKILEREEQQKKRREADLKQKKEREQQERFRRENQRKNEEERLKREKQQRQADQRRKQQQRIKSQKQRKQRQQRETEERKRQEERIRQEKQKRQRQQRQADEKRRQQQRKQKEKRDQEQRQRKQREKKQRQAEQLKRQQQKRKQEQKIRLDRQRQEKQIKQQRERQRKAEQQRIAREKQEKKRREQEERAKQQRERRQRQEREKSQREKAQKQRLQRQRLEKEKKEKERLQKQKQQKERQQRERLERQKAQKERQQKEKRQRQLRQAQQKRKQEQRQRIEKQKREKEKKQAEQKAKLEKQKKQKQQKQKQQRQKKAEMQRLKKQQEEAKAKNKGKPQPKKSSGINYGDFDDILDDDLEQMQKAGKLSPSGINSNVNQEEYGDDFDDQSPQKEDEISTKELISQADIKCLNDYMKGTSYARKNKVNAQLLNKASKYIEVFQELIQNRKIFIFDSALSKAVIDLGTQIQNPDTPEDDLRMSIQTIFEEMKRVYEQIFQGQQQMYPMTRYIFPFSFKNQFNIKLIQMIPQHTYFKVVMDQPMPQDEQISQKFQCLIEGLLHTFQLDGQPNLEEYIVNEQSKLVLDTFDRQLPCLLLLFALHYERNASKDILINQYTIQRFFYTSNIIEPLYDAIKDQEQISEHFNQLHEKYSTNDKIKVHNITVSSSDPEYQQQLAHSAIAIKEEFKKSKQSSYLNCFAVQIEEQGELIDKITVYMSLDRASPKTVVNYFLVSKDPDEQENAATIFDLISQGDQDFEVNVYTDFTRHNGLSSYSDWTLPLWAHVITKRKLSSLQAFRAMTFAMTPYYLSFKQMD